MEKGDTKQEIDTSMKTSGVDKLVKQQVEEIRRRKQNGQGADKK